jgi:hypothetical protein
LLILNEKIDFSILCILFVVLQDLRIFPCMLVLVPAYFGFLVCTDFSSPKDFSLPLAGQARDGNESGSGRVEQLPARQQRGCG